MDQAEFERYVRTGERNKLVLELMHNWCAHARVRNHGGTGLIAVQTGLPLGMFGMECDFAPAGGIAGWYLEEGVLDFHDRNCAHCDKRKPVGFPNLSQLVDERDKDLARHLEARERAQAEAAAARDARRQRRDALRVGQSAATCALLDDLESLDGNPSEDTRTKIVETVRLAPEVVTAPIAEYFFELADTHAGGCQREALIVLQLVAADPSRLTATALRCLARHDAVEAAAQIVMATSNLVDEAELEAAVPALAVLARPPRLPLGDDGRRFQPGPLEACFKARPDVVGRGVQRLLDSRRSYEIRIGTGALKTLSPIDPLLLTRSARTLAAKLARAHLLIDYDDSDRDLDTVCGDVRRSLAAALLHAPVDTDLLIAQYFEGANSEGEARLAGVYDEMFRFSVLGKATLSELAVLTVLQRIVKLAGASKNLEVLNEIVQIFRGEPEEMSAVVRKNLDLVLGAAAVLDDRIEAFDEDQKNRTLEPGATMLDVLEADNFRSALYYLKEAFASSAAKAAEGDRAATASYVDCLSKIDESRDGLASTLLREANHLISSPEGLNLVLPELYTALVGASNLQRAAAAEALEHAGNRRIEDLPELVLEAFVLLLRDPYVIVHKAAVRALNNIPLPPRLEGSANLALFQLIQVYSTEKDGRDFLTRCMELYLHRFATEQQLGRGLAAWFIKLLKDIPVRSNVRDFNSMARYLKDDPSYVDLIISVLDDTAVSQYREEDVTRLAYHIPNTEVLKRAGDLAQVAIRRRDRIPVVGAIVEILTRAGAWDQAVEAMEASWAQLQDTVQMRPRKWSLRKQVVAVQFEAAVASGNVALQIALKAQWESLDEALREDKELYAQRRNPLQSFLRTHTSR